MVEVCYVLVGKSEQVIVKNDAVDIAGQSFNNYPTDRVLKCAAECGFTHGWYEDFPGNNRDHWHLQNGPGLGVPPLPAPPNPSPHTNSGATP